MANCCSVSVKIYADKEDLDKVVNEINKAIDVKSVDPYAAFLGNLLMAIGYTKDEVNSRSIECAGTVCDMERDSEDCFRMELDCKWTPQIECIHVFLSHYMPDGGYELIYTAEEPAERIFESTDPDIIGKVNVYSENLDDLVDRYPCLEVLNNEPIVPMEDVVAALNEILGINNGSDYPFEELARMGTERIESLGEKVYITLNEYCEP